MNLKGKLVATAFRDKNTGSWSYKVFSYDYLGRIKDEYIFFQSTSVYKKITNEYDKLGNIVKQNVDNQFYYWYSYDEQNRLREVRSYNTDTYTSAKLETVYSYNESDKVTKTDFKSTSRQLYQTYLYDSKGRLDDLDGYRSTGTPEILFREDLGYFNNDNVSSTMIQNKGNTTWVNLTFTYSYKNFNQLWISDCTNNSYDETFDYDADGNFLSRSRASLIYYYDIGNTNKLTRLKKGSTTYNFTYDYKGNMLTDTRKTITAISYDRRNLPVTVTKSGVNYTYNYDDAGQRIYKQTSTSNKELYLRDHTGKELAVYDWVSGKLKMLNLYGNGLIGKVNVTFNAQNVRTDSRQYYFKDHLGSIRQTFDEGATVVSAQDYYPYGEALRSYVTGSNVNDKYKFTEKERDAETNYDYFGARYYDSELGRWLIVDPLARKYPGWSPYNYALNNPLKFIDPNGEWPWVANQINGWPTYSGLSGLLEGTSYSYMNYNKIIREQINHGQFENAVNYINNISSEVGKFLINTQIPVAVISESGNNAGETEPGVIGMILNEKMLLETTPKLANVFAHESIHMRGGDEFTAYGVCIALGLETIESLKSKINLKPDFSYFTSGINDKEKRENLFRLLKDWYNDENNGTEALEIYKHEGERWLEENSKN